MENQPKLTKPQQKMKDRFDRGDKITEVQINRNVSEMRFPDGSLCRYRTFWNLMRTLYRDTDERHEQVKQYFS